MYMLVLSQTIVKYLYTLYVYCGNRCFKFFFLQMQVRGAVLQKVAAAAAHFQRVRAVASPRLQRAGVCRDTFSSL